MYDVFQITAFFSDTDKPDFHINAWNTPAILGGYDYAGNLTSSTDDNGNITRYIYNSDNNLTLKELSGGN